MLLSTSVRNAIVEAIESDIGSSPSLKVFSGTQPETCSAADQGTLLVNMALPSDWLSVASGGAKSKSGAWSGTAAASGTASYFRIYGGGVCKAQGSASDSSGSGELALISTAVVSGQVVTVASFTLQAGNA